MPFRLKIALFSACISGLVLVVFGLTAWLLVSRQKLEGVDTEIRSLAARHPGWIGSHGNYQRLDDALQFIFGAAHEDQIILLDGREGNLKKELATLQEGRTALANAVEEGARNRYERLFKSKGENVVVGVEHSVCGGCHMKLPTQIITLCRGRSELVTCPNCGRILYYTPDMLLTAGS